MLTSKLCSHDDHPKVAATYLFRYKKTLNREHHPHLHPLSSFLSPALMAESPVRSHHHRAIYHQPQLAHQKHRVHVSSAANRTC